MLLADEPFELLRHQTGLCMITHRKSADMIRLLEACGWRLVRITGSHHHFKHADKVGLVTVPHPKKDIPPGTLNSILKQAGLK